MMNGLHDLLEKIRKIEEAEDVAAKGGQVYPDGNRGNGFQPNTQQAAPATANNAPATAQAAAPETMDQVVDRREKATSAKQILQTMVKNKNDLGMVNGNYIEAETGILRHSMIANAKGGTPAPTYIKSSDLGNPAIKQFVDSLKALGVEATPTKLPLQGLQIAGSWQDVLKIDINKLKEVAAGKAPAQAAAPANNAPANNAPANNAPANNAPANNAPATATATNQTDAETARLQRQNNAQPPANNAPATTANPEMTKKLDRLKEILGMKVTNATANTTGGTNLSQPAPAPAPATGGSPEQNIIQQTQFAESIKFRSRIASVLLESGIMTGIMEKSLPAPAQGETNPQRAELDALWAEISKAMETPGALTPEQRTDVENITQAVQQYQQNNPLTPGGQTGNDPTTNTNDPNKPTLDPTKNPYYDPNIAATQQLFNQKGITDNAGARIKVDGVWGWRTEEAKWNFFAKFKVGTPEANQYNDLGGKVKKELQWRVIADKVTGRTARGGPDRSQQKDSAIGNPSPQALKTMGISSTPSATANDSNATANTTGGPNMGQVNTSSNAGSSQYQTAPAKPVGKPVKFGSVKDKNGNQVYKDEQGNQWTMPPNSGKWMPANMGSAPATSSAPANSGGADTSKIDAEIKRFTSNNNMSLQANKDYVAGLEKKKSGSSAYPNTTNQSAPAASTVPTDVLAKAVPKPKVDDQYWVNGVRYSFQNIPHAGQGWKQDDPGMFGADRTTRSRSNTKYTGPDKTRKAESVEESGFMNDELNRLISLVHHR